MTTLKQALDDCGGSVELLNEYQAARLLGLSVQTLRRRRLRRHPPVWVKLGSRVLYRKQDLERFVAANLVRLDGESSGGRE
jgi:hypothetical protein